MFSIIFRYNFPDIENDKLIDSNNIHQCKENLLFYLSKWMDHSSVDIVNLDYHHWIDHHHSYDNHCV
ncbi:hypothetical protein DERF_014132 [Dermatophagoides farinae]|uniref:Uncharacterized protein n=1 Tax=Dermatophagoides farinae TaxID=6954 RepID=A0A922HLF6_DERFA|nr:hypothetical protein DERF_014132 [Dermatophagoides farinae]